MKERYEKEGNGKIKLMNIKGKKNPMFIVSWFHKTVEQQTFDQNE